MGRNRDAGETGYAIMGIKLRSYFFELKGKEY